MIAIAIDGPSGAGKSTIARALAQELHFSYIDTGALYRAIALYVLRAGVDPHQSARVQGLLTDIRLELSFDAQGIQHVILCEEDVSDAIRAPEMGLAASAVSAIPAVRDFLIALQRDVARAHSVIMDGRDIGTVILPQAQVKIFLTASDTDRARRRFLELCEKGHAVVYEEVLRDLRARDLQDSTRSAAPLVAAPDAIIANTTGNTLEESIHQLSVLIRDRLQKI